MRQREEVRELWAHHSFPQHFNLHITLRGLRHPHLCLRSLLGSCHLPFGLWFDPGWNSYPQLWQHWRTAAELKQLWRYLIMAVNSCSLCLLTWSSGSTAARLLGLRVRIPPRAWMSVSCQCCVLSEVCATGRSLVQRSRTECVSLHVMSKHEH